MAVADHLIWIPEFGESIEIDLGAPVVHNGQEGRFELAQPPITAGISGVQLARSFLGFVLLVVALTLVLAVTG